jgi:putative methyltransferase
MDASSTRSKTLQKMVSVAGADQIVTILAGQDFLALDPRDERFAQVSGLLLDPSCSGSGIIGRDCVPKLALPETRSKTKDIKSSDPRGKKRKWRNEEQKQQKTDGVEEKSSSPMDIERLLKLANLQTHIVEHALSFPAAYRVTYSTCSTHVLENEAVVSRVLASDVARSGGWRIMRRDEQPEGLRKWRHRGICEVTSKPTGMDDTVAVAIELTEEQLDACLRCFPGDDEGTGGFFVAGFVRDEPTVIPPIPSKEDGVQSSSLNAQQSDIEGDEDWEGFSD